MTSRLLLVHCPDGNISDVQPELSSLVSDATDFKGKTIPYYAAIPGSFKHLSSSIGILSYISETDAVGRVAPSAPTSHNDVEPTKTQEAVHPHSPSADRVSASEADQRDATAGGAQAQAHDPSHTASTSQGDIITWIDNDIDDTDYKNMPDYDPDQEESEYESTPEPDELPSTDVPPPSISSYVKIYDSDTDTLSTSEERPVPYLLLLFIPKASLALSEPNATAHGTFLENIKRFPCMTSLPSYVHISAFTPDDTSPERSYLVVQSFSSLERRSIEWLALKRKEAKHWWRKEERGVQGVRAGFFEFQKTKELGQ